MDDPAEILLVGLLTLLVITTAGVWATGQLAGLLFTLAWPRVAVSDVFAIVAALPHHLSDPRQAWPAPVRGALPGPAGFAAAALLVLAAFTAATIALLRKAGAHRSHRGFASRAQMAAYLSQKAVLARGTVVRPSLTGQRKIALEDVGVRAGRAARGGMSLAISSEASVLLMAAPRQGKTSMIIIPWLHRWPGPALVTSLRKDVLEATALLREQYGRPVMVMAPTGMIAWPEMACWSPADRCQSFDKARSRADVMVTVGKTGTGTGLDAGNAAYFGMTATNLLAGWLHAAALTGGSMSDVLRWALDERDDQPVKILRDHPDAAPGTAAMLDAIYRSPEATRSNMWTTVQTAVAPLLAPSARATFTPPPGDSLDIEDFLNQRGTLYLLVEKKQATDLAPLISAFIDEVTETAKRLADASPGGRLDPPLGLFGDEIANISPLPNLPDLMSFAGGTGIFVVAVLQNRAQAEERWGREGAAMLWGAATVKIALGGLSGDELSDLSALAGEYRELLTTYQRSSGGGHSIQFNLHDRRTLTPEAVRTLDEQRREALIIHATTPAVRARLTRHYEGADRELYRQSAVHAARMITAAGRHNESGEPAVNNADETSELAP